jgi:hypothetical protein
VAYDWSLEIAIAPDGALQRIAAAINRPKKRAFGIFKTANEYVGFVRDDTFEIWERQQRAVHAVGSVRGRRGGSRIEVRFIIPSRTRALIAGFFALYAVAAVGIALRDEGALGAAEELVIAAFGALVLALTFMAAGARQRAALRGFFDRLLRELPRI